MADISFSERAWEDFQYWMGQDKKTVKRISHCGEVHDGLFLWKCKGSLTRVKIFWQLPFLMEGNGA